jgi:purine-cytosine permease-like protein
MRAKWIVLGILLLIACAGPLIGLWLGSLPAGVGQTVFGFMAFLALFCIFFGAVGRPGERGEEE